MAGPIRPHRSILYASSSLFELNRTYCVSDLLSMIYAMETTEVTAAQQPADWNKPCSDEHLAGISPSIVDWRAVSPFLGLTEAEEIAILGSNPHSVPVQKITMLRKWKQKRGAKATYKRLCRVFRDCGSRDLEEKVTELLVAESSSSSDEEGEKKQSGRGS